MVLLDRARGLANRRGLQMCRDIQRLDERASISDLEDVDARVRLRVGEQGVGIQAHELDHDRLTHDAVRHQTDIPTAGEPLEKTAHALQYR